MPAIAANLPVAISTGLAATAWYALPDAVRSRGARGVLKVGILCAAGAAWALLRVKPVQEPGPDGFDQTLAAIRENPGKAAAIAAVVVTAGTAVSVIGEKATFAFGERRRARGVRFAHTVPALVLGALTAVAALAEEQRDQPSSVAG
ncbi:MAG: hypothetical protein QM708_04430 [Propioniciclava sp.]|uniref:hypothetical protein n=1 Tax=Propioniciclava sp. TaxID=2038686 RepID=UPI0039E670C0